jgi:hypothetical protein
MIPAEAYFCLPKLHLCLPSDLDQTPKTMLLVLAVQVMPTMLKARALPPALLMKLMMAWGPG